MTCVRWARAAEQRYNAASPEAQHDMTQERDDTEAYPSKVFDGGADGCGSRGTETHAYASLQ